jgi:hypothetical protein
MHSAKPWLFVLVVCLGAGPRHIWVVEEEWIQGFSFLLPFNTVTDRKVSTVRVFRRDSPGKAAQWLARSIRESWGVLWLVIRLLSERPDVSSSVIKALRTPVLHSPPHLSALPTTTLTSPIPLRRTVTSKYISYTAFIHTAVLSIIINCKTELVGSINESSVCSGNVYVDIALISRWTLFGVHFIDMTFRSLDFLPSSYNCLHTYIGKRYNFNLYRAGLFLRWSLHRKIKKGKVRKSSPFV